MRFKVVLALCATMVLASATAQAGWWHRHHRCPHCYGAGAAPMGVAVSGGGEFSSASGEAYVVRTAPERVRYYAVSERLLADPLDFRSARSTEEVAREAARAELGRIDEEKARSSHCQRLRRGLRLRPSCQPMTNAQRRTYSSAPSHASHSTIESDDSRSFDRTNVTGER